MDEPGFLVHEVGDHVGVAVRDLSPGAARGQVLDDNSSVQVDVLHEVPLGHKVALSDLGEGDDVIEYGVRVGLASAEIRRGQYVHIHNVRSARWQNSVA